MCESTSPKLPRCHAAAGHGPPGADARARARRGSLPWGAVARLRGAPSPSWRRPRSQQAAGAERVKPPATEEAAQPAPDTPASKTVEGRYLSYKYNYNYNEKSNKKLDVFSE